MNAIKHGYKCMNHVKIAPCNACNFLLMNVECFLYIATLAIFTAIMMDLVGAAFHAYSTHPAALFRRAADSRLLS